MPSLRATNVVVLDHNLQVDLNNGRKLSVPLEWFPTLLNATKEQLADWRLIGGGYGIHWDQLDEDLSVSGLMIEIERRSPPKT